VQQADALVKQFAKNVSALTAGSRAARARAGRYHPEIPISLPAVVVMPGHQPPGGRHAQGNSLNLQFDASGAEAFPTTYQALLQSIYTTAQPTLDALFGPPAVGGTVHVANFDATIGDRQAIAGGYYLPDNGNRVPEIRFPVYNANEATAVNFIHCLLLAYLGPDGYASDAFEEGLVRAVTMRIARTPGALPSTLSAAVIQNVLDNSYDVGPGYAWCNQRALGGNPFIAPNLVSAPLPSTGGSGPYLLRYLMSGSAWQKVLVEYPAFASQLNQAVYATPTLGSDIAGLQAAAQTILNNLNPTNPTIEGLSFAEWFKRQFILETGVTFGRKLLVQPSPITSGLSGTDFGVFLLEAIYFSTDASGNETLLSGTSYPIFWDNQFNRINTSAADEIISITASDGTVGPNFPDQNSGQPYAVTVDVPVGDSLVRTFLPAGAIATTANPTANDFYGTVQGVALNTGDTLTVRVTVGGNVFPDIAVKNGAFGTTLGSTANYNGYASVDVTLIRTRSGTPTVLLEQIYDKGPGSLAVDLRAGGEANYSFPNGLAAGIQLIGLPVDPFASLAPAEFGVPSASLLMARYDSGIGGYFLFPNLESPTIGHGYFLRLDSAQPSFSVAGRASPNVSTAVALKPGWNLVTVPLPYSFTTSTIRVVHAGDFPLQYSDSVGTLIGTDIFVFAPGAADQASGVPEGGTFTSTTQMNPGTGYFVRVLSAEGVSLVFDPPSSQLLSRTEPFVQSTGNVLRAVATQLVQTSDAYLGMSSAGSSRLNLALDSEVPPGIGGFQASIKGTKGTMYRDIRGVSGAQTFTLSLDGLRAGQPVTLNFERSSGLIRTFKLIDLTTHRVRTLFPGQPVSFTPTTASRQFSVILGAR
jgi:hypothetical protein